jgi:hypothetical protein
MLPDRTSTLAIQASALMRCHPDYSGGRRRLASRSPHGHEQHARTTDATDKGPRALQSYGRYLVALYNQRRPHQGRWCFGKTPMQTFLDALPLAKEKIMVA